MYKKFKLFIPKLEIGVEVSVGSVGLFRLKFEIFKTILENSKNF